MVGLRHRLIAFLWAQGVGLRLGSLRQGLTSLPVSLQMFFIQEIIVLEIFIMNSLGETFCPLHFSCACGRVSVVVRV